MNLRQQVLKEHSAENRDLITSWIGTSEERCQELIHLFLTDENLRVCQRAAWPLMHLAQKQRHLVLPYYVDFIDNLENAKHDAVIRNTLRILQDEKIPESHEGKLYELCFEYLCSISQPIAIKVFGMSILGNIAQKFPELKEELIAEIEYQYPHGSKGFQARSKRVLKNLRK